MIKAFDSRVMLVLAVVLAFIFPGFSGVVSDYLIVVIILMMVFSMKEVGTEGIGKAKKREVLSLLLINSVFLSIGYILAAKMFVLESYRDAIIVFGLMPPAAGIVSVGYILGWDTTTGVAAEFISYIAGIALIPIAAYMLFEKTISPLRILNVLIVVLVLPFLVSRAVYYAEKKRKKDILSKKTTKNIVNALYAVLFYIIIGMNKDAFLSEFNDLASVFAVFFGMTFVLGTIVLVCIKKNAVKSKAVNFVLFGTMKNGSIAIAVTLLLFGKKELAAFAVQAVLGALYIIYLEWLVPFAYKRKAAR